MNKLPLSAMAALLLITFNLSFSTARAQGTAFTYQGRLNDVSGPANGTYDFGFTLYATNVTGLPVAAPVFAAGTVVSNGLFITTLDFGPGAFTGTSNWLDIEVRTNGALLFAELSPRQMITPTPYALVAATLSGVVSSQNLPGFLATNNYDAIGGGFNNVNSPAGRNTIGGGSGNSTGGPGDNDELDTIGGGMGNMIQSSQYGTIGGGQNNLVGAYYGTVGGGANNQASGYIGTVAGGDNNWASGQYAFVGGGLENKAYADYSAVAGGYYNVAFGVGAFIGGGGNDGKHIPGNTANGPGSVIGGGVGNVTGSLATNSVVPGGFQNSVGGSFSFAAGQQAQATNQGTFVWADSQNAPFASTADNQFSVRAAGGVRLVTTGAGMSLDGPVNANAFVGNGGGLTNVNLGIAGLNSNDVKFVGADNVYLGQGAGNFNVSNAGDTALGANALGNLNNNSELTVGADNTALGSGALAQTVSGTGNTAVGQGALAGNTNGNAKVALGSEAGYLITGNNNVDIANPGVATDSGIIRIGTPGTQTATYLAGTVYANGLALTSDRNAKENFQPVDNQAVLARVAALPVTQWNYKTDHAGVRHIGPMAQDFQAAFGLDGADDRHISMVDEGGVALAAIQGLNEKLQEKDAEIAQLQAKAAQVDDLERQLHDLAAAVKALTQK